MARFIYEAKKDPINVERGTIVADNKNAAIQKIGRMGYYLISIGEEVDQPKSGDGKDKHFFGKVSLKNIARFTRQLSDLLESGLTIVKALDILYGQTENRVLKAAILDIKDFCISGNPLSDALSRHPSIFSNLYISMVKSGETGGALENILKRLADFNEKQLEIQTKLRTALAYPALMSIVGCITIIVLVTFVVPKMVVMFGELGQALPIPTQILLTISNFVRNYWWLTAAGIVLIAVGMAKAYDTEEGRVAIDRLRLMFPLAGQLIMKVEIARFSRTLGTLLNNGVPILESLRIASETIENMILRREIGKAYVAVREGSSLANGFVNNRVIPLAVINMIAVGEEGGHLERSLFKVAESYEREADEAVKIMMSLLEPILILTLGVIVGFIVISMLLPIFEINFLVR